MGSEPPIELQDHRKVRISTDSLQNDISEAIRAANTLQVHDPTTERRGSNAETIRTATSGNSLLTGNSYIDFDTNSRQISDTKAKIYRNRLQHLQRSIVKTSVNASSRAIRPLKIIKRPFTFVKDYWRRRNLLPATSAGRKIPIDLVDPHNASQIDERTSKPYCSNVITSSVYTIYDFFPRQLIVQFSKMANLYFLFVAILQMIPSWSTTGNYTTIVPLCVFVLISMSREGYEDWNRHRNDREENNREVLVVHKNEETGVIEYETKKWKHVQVGELVRILQNEWVPADIVLLHSSGIKGQCAVETLALDGETTLKSREVPPDIQNTFNVENIGTARALVTTEDPNLDLFNFEGTLEIIDPETKKPNLIPLETSNIVYRGSALRNTASVIGVCIFTGKETKMQLNASKDSRTKTPKLQGKVNRIVGLLAAYVLLLSGFFTLVAGKIQDHHHYWYLQGISVTTTQNIMGFIIMFNTLIPLSLYVSMEICKVIQQVLMQNDIDMYDSVNDVRCNVQTASLNEELGQVSYVFSDKTGTLTDNIMLFRKLSVGGHPWIHDIDLYFENDESGYLFHKAQAMDIDNLEDDQAMLLEQLAKLPRKSFGGRVSNAARISMSRPSLSRPSLSRPSLSRPSLSRSSVDTGNNRFSGGFKKPSPAVRMQDAPPRPSGVTGVSTQWQSSSAPLKPQSTPSTLTLLQYIMAKPNSAYAEQAKFFLLALALCHSATPEVDLSEGGGTGDTEIEQLDYQASSPDELALVAAARDLGYLVIDRQHDSITIRTYPQGFDNHPKDEVYSILDTIEFTSGRKRMSVVVKLPDDRIVVFCKGADNVVIERLRKSLLGAAHTKKTSLYKETQIRRSVEAELANENRGFNSGIRPSIDSLIQSRTADLSIEESGRKSMQLRRQSIEQAKSTVHNRQSVHSAVADAAATVQANVARTSVSLDLNRSPKPQAPFNTPGGQYHRNNSYHKSSKIDSLNHEDMLDIEGLNERQVLENTLEQIDEFSTEGLRTLLYGHRFISPSEYESWKKDYDEARAAISDRQAKVDAVGERLETEFSVTGATAIEDKLQKGVPDAIDKLRRANIRMWMLTGDKRETAVNIGYSCRLIKDFSTLISLKSGDNLEAKVMAALEELDNSNIAHCVVVVDGQTLATIEKDPILLSLFVDLGLRADSAIVCRASPAQKANIVKCVRQREPSKVMLAIGDGANDIAMIQAADVGVGIAGREGLQAARTSDFSIGQFRFLLKLLLVHGRWNYVRTCKYILATFYKEFMFYMAQAVFQRYTMFTGTSVFESWSISMFNTLFTSLPVICVGTLDQDLTPTTLIAVPELYRIGPENREFKLWLFFEWICIAMLECLLISFLSYKFYGEQYAVRDNSMYPLGVTIYASIVGAICIKIQFVSMVHYITLISLLVVFISFVGYLLFNILIGLVYIVNPAKTYYAAREFWNELIKELAFWATLLLCVVIVFLFETLLKILSAYIRPTDTDAFQAAEKDPYIMRRLEAEAELELHQGWEYQDQLDHSWTAIFRGKWPGQPRATNMAAKSTTRRKRLDILAEKLKIKKPADYEKEIQEILERRQQQSQQQSQHQSQRMP